MTISCVFLFICCHPELPANPADRAGAAHRLRVYRQGDRARFLVGESAMEQRITRAKARVAKAASVPFEARARWSARSASPPWRPCSTCCSTRATSRPAARARSRAALCEEAIRLARLLLRLFPAEPEIMGLTALMLLQHARAPARLDPDGAVVLLEEQDRAAVGQSLIAEGLALIDKADAAPPPRPLPGPGGDRGPARARGSGRRRPIGRRSSCSMARWSRCSPRPWSRSIGPSPHRRCAGPPRRWR